jgi:uncharacterized protein (TIGR03118 family)
MSHHHKQHNHRERFNCNGEYHDRFKVNNIVSNLPNNAKNQDPYLVDAWNIVIVNKNDMWVSNKVTAFLTNYDLSGNIISTPVKVPDIGVNPALPTGLIINESTGFVITKGPNVASSYLLVCTENGTICGYNPLVDTSNAIVAVDNSGTGACYKDLAMVNNYLCATDFHNKKVDVFDFNFVLTMALPFTDLDVLNPIPANYGPYGIENIDGFMYVTYAEQKAPANTQDLPGKGHGYISIFNKDGLFVKRFASRGKLNSPYGIVKTPETFGDLSDKILVGNHGNGKMYVYDCDGEVIYILKDKHKNKICIHGLHGLTKYDCETHYIYWASGSSECLTGLIGNIRKEKHC